MSRPIQCISAGILVADHVCQPIDHHPVAGELVLTDRLMLTIGGCAANVAIDLARLDVEVGVIGCVGRDVFGRFVTDTLDEVGIDTAAIRADDKAGTSGTLIVNVRGEDRRFVHYIGANAAFTVDDLPIEEIRRAKVFYLGGYLLMPNLDPERLGKLLGELRRSGVKTVVDVVVPGEGDHWSRLRPVLAETDFFLPNGDESAVITGHTDPIEQAAAFREAGADTVVITCGGEGAVLVGPNERLRSGTFPTEFIGGTGAGDAFDAGFIAGLLAGLDSRGCLAWGSALGASCVRSVSATDAVFTRAEASAFLAAHHLEFESF
ncbi:MAG: carbohydrate kinase family protein [Planctomycetales bacterium]|nr:carbohydrate kinase family protein [Planctomycetales bacterium]